MKTILLPTDFSINSINAINYAIELFKDVECHFYILNVQKASAFISDDMMVVSSSATIYNTIIDAAKKSISNIISTIEKKHKNKKHHFTSVVDYDNFIDSINQVSKKHSVDLIVMGTRGASGLSKVIFGSNTVRVIQRCNMPVLAIPDGCKFDSISKIVFATSNSKQFNKNEFKPLKEIMALGNSKLDILHLADQHHLAYNAYDNMDFFNTYYNDAKHEFIDTISNDMFNAVYKYIEHNEIKILAMMNKKHSFLERLFIRHNVETFAFNIDIPFLVMQHS
ncbi:universal stress protein [Jejuia spongiicola]|uniref:Universal stress protein n=1 Tax=Jejuia spongiicola TaxID=2942207 RepID=A0ABT0QGU3_9FLAO|nr:universal stress protein [Jejuia spongiicola]MCL6296064.1 universal stress protein [Jejuia spongiicola]